MDINKETHHSMLWLVKVGRMETKHVICLSKAIGKPLLFYSDLSKFHICDKRLLFTKYNILKSLNQSLSWKIWKLNTIYLNL